VEAPYEAYEPPPINTSLSAIAVVQFLIGAVAILMFVGAVWYVQSEMARMSGPPQPAVRTER